MTRAAKVRYGSVVILAEKKFEKRLFSKIDRLRGKELQFQVKKKKSRPENIQRLGYRELTAAAVRDKVTRCHSFHASAGRSQRTENWQLDRRRKLIGLSRAPRGQQRNHLCAAPELFCATWSVLYPSWPRTSEEQLKFCNSSNQVMTATIIHDFLIYRTAQRAFAFEKWVNQSRERNMEIGGGCDSSAPEADVCRSHRLFKK